MRLVQRDRKGRPLGEFRQPRGVHVHQHYAGIAQLLPRLVQHRQHLAFRAGPERRRHAQPQARQRHRLRHGLAAHGGVQQRHVAHAACHGPDGVSRAADGQHAAAVVAPFAAAVAHRGPQPGDAAERGGNAHRAARVRAQAGRRDARGHRRAGAAGRAAGDAVAVVRVVGEAGERREVGRRGAEGQLMHVGLAHHDGAGVQQPLQRGCVGRGAHVAQGRRAARGGQSAGVDVVLHHDGQAGQRGQRLAAGAAGIHVAGGLHGAGGVQRDHAVQVLQTFGTGQQGLHVVLRAQAAGPHRIERLRRRQFELLGLRHRAGGAGGAPGHQRAQDGCHGERARGGHEVAARNGRGHGGSR